MIFGSTPQPAVMSSKEFFMELRVTDLKTMCRRLGLSGSGTKDVLATRLVDKYKEFDREYVQVQNEISQIENQIRKAEISRLEHEISDCFDKYTLERPRSTSSSVNSSGPVVLARSSEPFVTKRIRLKQDEPGHRKSSVQCDPSQNTARMTSAMQTINHDNANVVIHSKHDNVKVHEYVPVTDLAQVVAATPCIGAMCTEQKYVSPQCNKQSSDIDVDLLLARHKACTASDAVAYDVLREKIIPPPDAYCDSMHNVVRERSLGFSDVDVIVSYDNNADVNDTLLQSLLPSPKYRDYAPVMGVSGGEPAPTDLKPVKHEYSLPYQDTGSINRHQNTPSPLPANNAVIYPTNSSALGDSMKQNSIDSSMSSHDVVTKPKDVSPSDFCSMAMNLIDHNAKTLAYAIQSTKMPVPEPKVFSGEVLEYNDWNKSFSRFVDSNVTLRSADKLFYLTKYTAGEVLAIVNGYYALEDEGAYDAIKQILHDRYGNPYKVSQAYLSKLASWPKVSGDPKSLQRLVDFLKSVRTAMVSVPNLSNLNHSQENAKLKQLLPQWLKRKWNKHAVLYSKSHSNTFPEFSVFVEFLDSESELLNHPIAVEGEVTVRNSDKRQTPGISHNISTASQPGTVKQQGADNSKSKPSTTGNTKPKSGDATPMARDNAKSVIMCSWCDKEHKLYKCEQFKAASVKDRYDHVLKFKRCENCLNPAHGKPCTIKLTCKACKTQMGHNYLLHDALSKENVTSQSTGKSSVKNSNVSLNTNQSRDHVLAGKSSYMVPVYVSHESDPSVEVLTYAMLDNQSSLTYITDDVAMKVSTPKTRTTIPISTMTNISQPVTCNVYADLVVRGYNCSERLPITTSYGCNSVPNNQSVPSSKTLSDWKHLAHVVDEFPPLFDCEVGMLIGHDCHYALVPEDVVLPTSTDEPFAVKTPLGWCLVGPVSKDQGSGYNIPYSHVVSNVPTSNNAVPLDVVRQLESGFDLPGDSDQSNYSIEDIEFLETLRDGIRQGDDGLYSMPLPFSGGKPPTMPNNRAQAVARLKALNSKFKDKELFSKYSQFMTDLIQSGDAELVPPDQLDKENKWYLPHHNVVNVKKPEKVRVVFDGSCVFKGVSLNSTLLSGPDLNNSLFGVLLRFRENKVAIACDIEKMFYRFKVQENHRDFLRFLWYDEDMKICEYRMTKHIFGASSSPGCSKFGLLQIAEQYGSEMPLAKWFIERCFYVDDGLYSCKTAFEAAQLLKDTSTVCGAAGLKVHKILSNSSEVLSEFAASDVACDVKQFEGGVSGCERALGIDWSPVSDMFSFSYERTDNDEVFTRRSMLSLLSSIFDPLGLISPVILPAKQVLQTSFQDSDWDTPVPPSVASRWKECLLDIANLNQIKIPRCASQLSADTTVIRAELHTFVDACERGYGCCSYLRLIGSDGSVSCCLLAAKSKVVPLKGSTIPRLELQAALLGTEMGSSIAKELSIKLDGVYYWSDSEIVLAYLHNTKKKLKTFVRNRVRMIREMTSVECWHHVSTSDNPADLASRGCDAGKLLESLWFTGPQYLSDGSFNMEELRGDEVFLIPDNDNEVQEAIVAHATTATLNSNCLLDAVERCSSWVAAVKVSSIIHCSVANRWKSGWIPGVESFQSGEHYLLKQAQLVYFPVEYNALSNGKPIPANSTLRKLDPILDDRGVMRVGGRLGMSQLAEAEKHPVIVPKSSHVSQLIIDHLHRQCSHQGREITMSFVRSAGYWIENLNSEVTNFIDKCITCRKLRRPTETQKMSELPSERVNPSPPFTYVGVDFFGPFHVKDGRRQCKRYGVLFTCLYSRAVHVETCDDLSSDAFINCLRTVIALRGHIRQIRCDQGTNLVGASNEFSNMLRHMPNSDLKQFLQDNKCEFIFNTPSASHMGGVWERQIRSVRAVLDGILSKSVVTDSASLRTILYECAAIVNSRPMTTIDAKGLEPLTPNHLLTMKTNIVMPPPPGEFEQADQYSRKRWMKVQSIASEFWSRWKPQYLASLQSRQCWTKEKKYHVGDLVLLKDESVCRGQWPLGRIEELITSGDGLVRRVKVKAGHSVFERPVHKLVLLESAPQIDSP